MIAVGVGDRHAEDLGCHGCRFAWAGPKAPAANVICRTSCRGLAKVAPVRARRSRIMPPNGLARRVAWLRTRLPGPCPDAPRRPYRNPLPECSVVSIAIVEVLRLVMSVRHTVVICTAFRGVSAPARRAYRRPAMPARCSIEPVGDSAAPQESRRTKVPARPHCRPPVGSGNRRPAFAIAGQSSARCCHCRSARSVPSDVCGAARCLGLEAGKDRGGVAPGEGKRRARQYRPLRFFSRPFSEFVGIKSHTDRLVS